ncbi:hypothetical protein [Bacillus pseudomycoides]|nr:hypothetical protein [Bacillus pseudomycoides]
MILIPFIMLGLPLAIIVFVFLAIMKWKKEGRKMCLDNYMYI